SLIRSLARKPLARLRASVFIEACCGKAANSYGLPGASGRNRPETWDASSYNHGYAGKSGGRALALKQLARRTLRFSKNEGSGPQDRPWWGVCSTCREIDTTARLCRNKLDCRSVSRHLSGRARTCSCRTLNAKYVLSSSAAFGANLSRR